MGAQMSRNEFEWVYTEQPHVSRRKMILEKYPEIKKLMGIDHMMKYKITFLVIFNILCSYFVSQVFNLSYFWITVLSYILGGVVNHMLVLAVHEISHNLVFGNSRPLTNRLFGMWANLPVIFPMSISFKRYHVEHHRFLAIDGYDVDLPTDLEARLFYNPVTKMLWLFLQPAFYSLRPFVVRPRPPSNLETLNTVIQLTFNVILYYFCGFKAVYYLMAGTVLALGLHPMAAHFVAEHYMYEKGHETYSYYGPMNYLTWNVGYHMEHHDFPYIPGSRLPEVKRIAAEFYDNLPQHSSWIGAMWEFIFNPECGPYGRIKREYDDIFGARKESIPYVESETVMSPTLPGDPVAMLDTRKRKHARE